jgi:hypothetical protein
MMYRLNFIVRRIDKGRDFYYYPNSFLSYALQ